MLVVVVVVVVLWQDKHDGREERYERNERNEKKTKKKTKLEMSQRQKIIKKNKMEQTTHEDMSVISTADRCRINNNAPVQCQGSNHQVHQEYVVNHQYIFLIFLFQSLNDGYVHKHHLIVDLMTNPDVSYMVHC